MKEIDPIIRALQGVPNERDRPHIRALQGALMKETNSCKGALMKETDPHKGTLPAVGGE